ncbi:MAG TPA: glucose-6-phosphate dehydrogenase [Thermoanaerobaculia bacterium]|nr:glucose-6-phosphate dehydrogenase [Thermoanaerobaculia bacterium]
MAAPSPVATPSAASRRTEAELRPPCTLVIFGASGDLTRRLLAPAIAHLNRDGAISPDFAIIGIGRTEYSDEDFRAHLEGGAREFTPPTQGRPGEMPGVCRYIAGNFSDAGLYTRILAALDQCESQRGGPRNRIFYFATPPDADETIVRHVGESGLARVDEGWVRAVVEKPFGHDLASCRELNATMLSVFKEKQIYRIDHYLGKETVQNIFVLRFANGIFEPMWNHRYIDHVQISVAEAVGVGHRAGFYESAGVVRDMFQNHLMQLLTLTAMEPPAAYEADAIRAEKVKVLQSIRPFPVQAIDDWAVRGQYGSGVVGGKRVPGYREEPNVDSHSNTPTYAAIRFAIDNWRWAGVPFYLRSGKRLEKRVSEIAIEFTGVPHRFFSKVSGELLPNVLRLHIQPDEGVSLKFSVKIPGPTLQIQSVYMDFPYSKLGAPIAGGYERLLLDVTHGDQTLFIRGDEAEHAWEVLMPLLDYWERVPTDDFPNYAAGTWGPESADKFLERDGRRWRTL